MADKNDTQPNIADNAPEGLALSGAEQKKARAEGAKEAVKDAAKDSYMSLTDGVLPGDPPQDRWPGKSEIQQYAGLIDLPIEQFKKAIDGKQPSDVPEEKVAGLLGLERAGKNRTPYVQAMVKRLGVSSPYEVTDAGPDYTNDVSPITKL